MSVPFDIGRLPVAAFATDSSQCVLRSNTAFQKLLGLSEAEISGQHLGAFFNGMPEANEVSGVVVTLRSFATNVPRPMHLHLETVASETQGWLVALPEELLIGPYSKMNEQTPFEVVLIQDGIVVYSNKPEIAPVGTPAEVSVAINMHPDDRKMVADRINARERGKDVPRNYRYRQLIGGGVRWMEVWSTLIDLGGRLAIRAVSLDVTDRVETEQALLKVERMYQHSQKMEAIGRLAGGIAHDFNNLLTVILSSSELGLHGVGVEQALKEIRAAAERAGELTSQLLTFSRSETLDDSSSDATVVCVSMKKMLQRIVGEHIRITMIAAEAPLWIGLGSSKIEQIVSNLVVNACDAMPEGGTVVVRTQEVMRPAAQAAEARYAMISVEDEGMGISEAVRDKVFDAFFTTKEPGKGTGFGLSIVSEVAKSVGGVIEMDSKEDEGTVVRVLLPLVAAPVSVNPEPVASSGSLQGVRVLVVEDEDSVGAVVARSLQQAGAEVETVHCGKAALDAIARDSSIGLVLTDVIMPGMSGFELGQRLAEAHGHLPIVYMTGYAEEQAIPAGQSVDQEWLLRKPFKPDALIHMLLGRLQKNGS